MIIFRVVVITWQPAALLHRLSGALKGCMYRQYLNTLKIYEQDFSLHRQYWLRPNGRGFEPHRRHRVVSLSKNINPSLVLVQSRKIRPYITERLLQTTKVQIGLRICHVRIQKVFSEGSNLDVFYFFS